MDQFSSPSHDSPLFPPPEPPAESVVIETEIERLQRENAEISARYSELLDERSRSSSMSPSYLQTLPKSMIEKLRVTPEEEEAILYNYASTSSIPKTALATRIPVDKVRAVVYSPASQDTIADLRSAMRASVLSKIEETQVVLLDALQDQQKLDDSNLNQIATVFETISETQLSLVRAQRESLGPSAIVTDPTSVFTGEELEYMALLRRRLDTGLRPDQLPSGFAESDVFDTDGIIDMPESEDPAPAEGDPDLIMTMDEVHEIESVPVPDEALDIPS